MRKEVMVLYLLILLIIFALLLPLAAGFILERGCYSLIDEYNRRGEVAIHVLRYHRSWFTSKSFIEVTIKQPEILSVWRRNHSTQPFTFLIHQKIIHGPFIFTFSKDIRSYFTLGNIHSVVKMPATGYVFRGDENISYTGKDKLHLVLPSFFLHDAEYNIDIHLKSLETNLLIAFQSNHVNGSITANTLEIVTNTLKVQVPSINVQFKHYTDQSNLWLGETNLVMDALFAENNQGDTFSLKNINLKGKAFESEQQLNVERQLSINTIQLNDQKFGPLAFKLLGKNFNASAMVNIINSYRDILENGERYGSQTKKKLSLLIPTMINPGSSLTLENFNLETEEGHLSMESELLWPERESLPDDLRDLLQMSTLKLNLHISKPLANQLIHLASQSPYFYSIPKEQQQQLLAEQRAINMGLKLNFLLIASLVDSRSISDKTADELLTLQQSDAPLERYADLIKQEFLKKQMSLYTSYLLGSYYAYIQQRVRTLEDALLVYQKSVENEIHGQLNDWLKQKYINEYNNEYVVSLLREQGKLKLNNKMFNSE